MQMKNKLMEEKASMAVYVTVVLFSFLMILLTIYLSSASVRKSQLTTIIKIKQSYELYNDDVSKIYQEQLNKLVNAQSHVSNEQVLNYGE